MRTALLAVLALIVAGLPSAAHANQATIDISGRVILPADIPAEAEIWVGAIYKQDGFWTLFDEFELPLPGNGQFVLEDLPAGTEYRLHLDIHHALGFAGGFYVAPGEALENDVRLGMAVTQSLSGVELHPVRTTDISGTISLPAGFEWAPADQEFDWGLGDRVHIWAYELSPLDEAWVGPFRNTGVTPGSPDTFRIPGLRPGAKYALYVEDPSGRFPDGHFHHGVNGLVEDLADATRVLGGTSSIHITVGSALVAPALTSVSAPRVTGDAVVGGTLSADPGAWSLTGATFAYQWLRDGSTIAGATAASYTAVAADVGARLAVRVTASKAGYSNSVATSGPTTAVAVAPAPRATVTPTFSGKARLGKTLRARPGTWSVPGATFSYQWLRDGKTIKGATAVTYKLTKSDVGTNVSVRVTARVPGRLDGVASSSSAKVTKGKPKVTVKAKAVKAKKRAKVVVRVKAAGLAKPAGTLTVKFGKKSVKIKLPAKAKGKATVRLPRLKAGKYKLTVTYKPSKKAKKYVSKATAKKVTLRVK